MNVYTVLPGLLGVPDDADVDADSWPVEPLPPPPLPPLPFLPGVGLGDGAEPSPVADGAIAEPKVPDPLAFACEHAARKVTTTAPIAVAVTERCRAVMRGPYRSASWSMSE